MSTLDDEPTSSSTPACTNASAVKTMETKGTLVGQGDISCNCKRGSCKKYQRLARLLGIGVAKSMQDADEAREKREKGPKKRKTIAWEPSLVCSVKKLKGKGYQVRYEDKKLMKVNTWREVFGRATDHLKYKKKVDSSRRFVDAGGDSAAVWGEVGDDKCVGDRTSSGCHQDTCSRDRTSPGHLCPSPGFPKHLCHGREGCVLNSFLLLLPEHIHNDVALCNRFAADPPLNSNKQMGLKEIIEAGNVRFGTGCRKKNVNVKSACMAKRGKFLIYSHADRHCIAVDQKKKKNHGPRKGPFFFPRQTCRPRKTN
mmetsp:Transcript_36979/g.68250  ORF Transcript_36979/g.68250 Transcript_36979/m.68250 type:complete len:312 (-) Transcript_36979:223-1158(-)